MFSVEINLSLKKFSLIFLKRSFDKFRVRNSETLMIVYSFEKLLLLIILSLASSTCGFKIHSKCEG